MSLGYEIGKGKSLKSILSDRKTIAEGVTTTKAAKILADKFNLDLKIISNIYEILYNNLTVSKEIITRFF